MPNTILSNLLTLIDVIVSIAGAENDEALVDLESLQFESAVEGKYCSLSFTSLVICSVYPAIWPIKQVLEHSICHVYFVTDY